MMWVGPSRELIMLLRRPGQRWYVLTCMGRKKHYRKDGTCRHTEALLSRMKPKYRGRVKVDPWGGVHE